jgi:hypothetical protein
MASGKSLELAKIKPPPPRHLCICGKVWEDHLRINGLVKKRYSDDSKHRQAGHPGLNRRQRRAMRLAQRGRLSG